ncbi:glutamate-1-semialdehyde 2,1-aminomutase [Clostridia bacterium]|nr:glutamate-1-semialdehyde 2,1-aminomutase [Clostridia bacterium]
MTSAELFERAKKVLPGGVNSPVRAFRSVGIGPRFIARADGSKIYDVDGKEYIDYVCSWGPMILGHNHPEIRESVARAAERGLSYGAPCEAEVEIAELIVEMVPNVDKIRMVNSGTEAVMSAVRLARGYTGRDKIIKFDGCYHGHFDSMLVKTGSGALTGGMPDSLGVPADLVRHTLVAEYNDIAGVAAQFEANSGKVAAVVVEPVAANMGLVLPQPGFLQGLRELCDKHGALLIFDEVITGFRLAPGGAQEYFSVDADIVTFGKIIGGGMPVGAYGTRAEIMELVAPLGGVYQAGTLSGNPVAMAAGLAQLRYLNKNRGLYEGLETATDRLADGLRQVISKHRLGAVVGTAGSLCGVFFTHGYVRSLADAQKSDTRAFSRFFAGMLSNGVYMAPSQFEVMFVSAAHSGEDIDRTIESAAKVLSDWSN